MAWTQTDLDAIDKAIASGSRVVKTGDTMIEYRSIAEMQTVRAMIAQSLGLAAPKTTVGSFSSGLRSPRRCRF